MSLHRVNPRRDANEPEIRARFAMHGWHTEQRSSAGGWDLDAYPRIGVTAALRTGKVVVHVDVKDRTGKPTPAQVEKWSALAAKGIPVYVAHTWEDVDAIVSGTAEPWRPMGMGHALQSGDGLSAKARARLVATVARQRKP